MDISALNQLKYYGEKSLITYLTVLHMKTKDLLDGPCFPKFKHFTTLSSYLISFLNLAFLL